MTVAQTNWLTDRDRGRLIQCLGMIGSAHDGEALNAARLANQSVQSTGLTWPDVINPPSSPPSHPTRPRYSYVPRDWPTRWRWLACACLDSGRVLHRDDRRFLQGIVRRVCTPSADQLGALRAIAADVLVMAEAA
jgi:hypothetical protein